MIEWVDSVGFGRPATEALSRVIARAQAGRPLAPVTVVVPSNLAGLAARRRLGALAIDGTARHGIANVTFVTPLRLIDLLAADVLVDVRPLTNPVLASAVRRTLADDPHPFGEIADHVATETAVVNLYGELSRLTADALEAVRSDPWGGVAAGLHDRISDRLGGYHDEDAVARAVCQRADLAAAVRRFGHLVWHLPERLSPAQTELMARLLEVTASSVVIGVTGDAGVDRGVLDACRLAGVDVPATTPGGPDQPPAADRIISATDADEEIRVVVGSIMELVAEGVAPDRIGIFYPTPEPYVRTIEHHVAAAGLAANGPRADTLAGCVAGRTLLAALGLPDDRWRRDRVMALVSDGPIRAADGVARVATWERISREAGVVRGLEDWRRKLGVYVRAAASRLEAGSGTAQGDHDAARALGQFVDDLATAIEAVERASGWAAKTEAARQLLDALLGTDRHHQWWPEHERDELDRVVDALTRLATLDELEPTPDVAVFRRALEGELDVPRGRSSTFGTGVAYGPLASAAGHDLDAVFVVGMVEGRCPMPRRDEAMLPERVRLLAGGQLITPDAAMAAEHRSLLAAVAAAPPGRRTMTLPRGDLRSHRELLPSRWLLDTATSLVGTTVHSSDFHALGTPYVEVVPSFSSGLRGGVAASSLVERDLAAVASAATDRDGDRPLDPAHHAALAPVARAIMMQHARRSRRFTEWDGNLSGQPIPSPAAGDEILSATRLERWAHCGFQYFLHDVLHLRLRDDPERIVTVSPLDRGEVMHTALERFLTEVIDEEPPDPDSPWSPRWRARLHELGDECFNELEARGRTGRALQWRLERLGLHELLDRFLDTDDDQRCTNRLRPMRVELPFGLRGIEPVEVDLGDGRRLRLRGSADRVDTDDAGRHVIFDYKTGSGRKYAKLGDPDPVMEGTTLQLGVYAEAGRRHLGATELSGWYWLLEARDAAGPFVGYPWTAERRERFLDVLRTITDGIESGIFPQVPGEWDTWRRTHEGCAYCDFDSLCPAGRGEHADAKVDDPALGVRVALKMPEPPTAVEEGA